MSIEESYPPSPGEGGEGGERGGEDAQLQEETCFSVGQMSTEQQPPQNRSMLLSRQPTAPETTAPAANTISMLVDGAQSEGETAQAAQIDGEEKDDHETMSSSIASAAPAAPARQIKPRKRRSQASLDRKRSREIQRREQMNEGLEELADLIYKIDPTLYSGKDTPDPSQRRIGKPENILKNRGQLLHCAVKIIAQLQQQNDELAKEIEEVKKVKHFQETSHNSSKTPEAQHPLGRLPEQSARSPNVQTTTTNRLGLDLNQILSLARKKNVHRNIAAPAPGPHATASPRGINPILQTLATRPAPAPILAPNVVSSGLLANATNNHHREQQQQQQQQQMQQQMQQQQSLMQQRAQNAVLAANIITRSASSQQQQQAAALVTLQQLLQQQQQQATPTADPTTASMADFQLQQALLIGAQQQAYLENQQSFYRGSQKERGDIGDDSKPAAK